MDNIKVSVIIPIYKVEKYIERCVISLMEQTLRDVEYIFVDDASPDKSISILKNVLKKYPHRQNNVKLITHHVNKGLPAARNTGLSIAGGEYIYHCDSDDYVSADMLESLYSKAIEEDADIVWCDFIMDFGHESVYCKMFEPKNDDRKKMIKDYLSYGWNVVWNMIVKRKLYIDNNINSYEGYSFTEDFGLTARLVFYAEKIMYIPQAKYYYNRANQSSIVHQELSVDKRSKMMNDEITICLNIISFFKDNVLYEDFKQELSWRILKAKRGWLCDSNKWRDYLKLLPESNKYIMSNPFCSIKDKITQYLILHNWSHPLLYLVLFIDKTYKRLR